MASSPCLHPRCHLQSTKGVEVLGAWGSLAEDNWNFAIMCYMHVLFSSEKDPTVELAQGRIGGMDIRSNSQKRALSIVKLRLSTVYGT
jgi:hypothetical protein